MPNPPAAPTLSHIDTEATSTFVQDPAAFLSDQDNYVIADPLTALEVASGWDKVTCGKFMGWMAANSDQPHHFVLVKVPNGKLTSPPSDAPGETLMLAPDIRSYRQSSNGFQKLATPVAGAIEAPFIPYKAGPARVRPKISDGDYVYDTAGNPVMEPAPAEVGDGPSIGTTLVPEVPDDPQRPSFAFTPAMNGCAFAVTPSETPGKLMAWHFQSPNGGINQENANQLRNSTVAFWYGVDDYYHGSPDQLFAVSQFMVWSPQNQSWSIHSQPAAKQNFGAVYRPQLFGSAEVELTPGPNPTPLPPLPAPGPVPAPEPTGAPEGPTAQPGADQDAPANAPYDHPDSDAPSPQGSSQEPYRPASGDRPQGSPGGLDDPSDADKKRINDAVPLDEKTQRPQVHPDQNKGNWTAALNGDGFRTPGRNNNCVDVALSMVDTYSGHPTAAASRTPDPDGRHSDQGERNGRDRIENALGAKFADMGDGPEAYKRLEDKLIESGHGSQAVIITSDKEGRSHAWNAVNHHGRITYVDGQTGRRSDTPMYNGDNGVFAVTLDPKRNPVGRTDTAHQPDPDRAAPQEAGGMDHSDGTERPNGQNAPVDPPYAQTIQDYLAGGGNPLIHRAVRIEPQFKKVYGQGGKFVDADGNVGTPADYQKMVEWNQQHHLDPGDIDATVTVAYHVSGENAASQYISFSPNLSTPLHYSQHDFKLSEDAGRTDRPLEKWAPVITVDVNRLTDGNRLIDLSREEIRKLTDLPQKPLIEAMAKQDSEVLVLGRIPGSAVVNVHGVEERITRMSDQEKRNFLGNLVSRPHPEDPARAEWDDNFSRKVPSWFAEHFEQVIVDQPPATQYVSLAQRRAEAAQIAEQRKRQREAEAAQAQAAAASAPKSKKKKKPNPLLSFDDEME